MTEGQKTSVASRLLIKLPTLSCGKVSRARLSAAAQITFSHVRRLGGKRILRKLTLLGGRGDLLKNRIPHPSRFALDFRVGEHKKVGASPPN